MERAIHIGGLLLSAVIGLAGEWQNSPHATWFGIAVALITNLSKVFAPKQPSTPEK